MTALTTPRTIVGEPEVVEDAANESAHTALVATPENAQEDLPSSELWLGLKGAVAAVRAVQVQDGSIPDAGHHPAARTHTDDIAERLGAFAEVFPHDAAYLHAAAADFRRWAEGGFEVPDFLDSLTAFQPQRDRVDGLRHLVIFPMYTQNGSSSRLVEAVLVEVIWPEFVAQLEATDYSNALFVPIRFLDFTEGYNTNSAVLFPETVAMRAVPTFTWGAIFADREAARFRRVVHEASTITRLDLPADAQRLLDDQRLAEETFVMWDLIHDRTHMRGDLPFDPFMIKQRMPFFLYSLEELRCDLTAFREAVRLHRGGSEQAGARQADPDLIEPDPTEPVQLDATDDVTRDRALLVQYAVIFDRIFRFAITGTRVRNYDGLGGQLLFAWLHQHHVLHWTDTKLTIDWDGVPDAVLALGTEIDTLYWRSIDRPKAAHWLAAYELVAGTLTPHPASRWARGDLPLDGPPKGLTDAVMDDEFPLSMFYEALQKKMAAVIESTSGITAEAGITAETGTASETGLDSGAGTTAATR